MFIYTDSSVVKHTTYICMYIYVCVYIYIHIYIYIYWLWYVTRISRPDNGVESMKGRTMARR